MLTKNYLRQSKHLGNPFIHMGLNMFLMRAGGLLAKMNLSSFPSIGKLAEAKKLALRRGVWFRVLRSG